MIVLFNQIKRQPHPSYEFIHNGEIIATAKGLVGEECPTLNMNGEEYEIPLRSYKGKDDFGNSVPHIYDVLKSGNSVGIIYQGVIPQKKILFIQIGYGYYGLKLSNQTYYGYEIGFGEDEHYLCIKLNDKTICIVHKTDRVVNCLDTYTMYLENEDDLIVGMLFALYFENANYEDSYEEMDNGSDDTSCITTQKKLNAHYDSTFIPRIKALNNIAE